MVIEFDRLRKDGLKSSPMVLRVVAIAIPRMSQGEFHFAFSDLLNRKMLDERIIPKWIQSFQEYNNIVIRTKAGKLIKKPVHSAPNENKNLLPARQVPRNS